MAERSTNLVLIGAAAFIFDKNHHVVHPEEIKGAREIPSPVGAHAIVMSRTAKPSYPRHRRIIYHIGEISHANLTLARQMNNWIEEPILGLVAPWLVLCQRNFNDIQLLGIAPISLLVLTLGESFPRLAIDKANPVSIFVILARDAPAWPHSRGCETDNSFLDHNLLASHVGLFHVHSFRMNGSIGYRGTVNTRSASH